MSVVKQDEEVENQPQRRQGNQFAQKDEKALGILLTTSVADEIVHYLDDATSSCQAWEILEKKFGTKSKHSKSSLKM